MIIKVDFEFFRTPAGSEYDLIEGTYGRNVCDCCGRSRMCDYFRHDEDDPMKTTFLDLCRPCQKVHAEVVSCEYCGRPYC